MQLTNRVKRSLLVAVLIIGASSEIRSQTVYSFRSVNVPGAAYTVANANNNGGQIVGTFRTTELCCSTGTGYLLSNGAFKNIVYPSATQTFANSINVHQALVGVYYDQSGVQHGFLLKGGTYSSIDYPGAAATFAVSINDNGVICGGYSDGARYHGFVLHGTTYSTKDYPGSAGSEAATINNAGEVVGTYSLTDPLLNSGVLGYSMNGTAFTSVEFPSAV